MLISVTKYGSQDSDDNLFTDTLSVSDGSVYFLETQSRASGLKGIFGCTRSDIQITLPYNIVQPVTLNIQSVSGNIVWNGIDDTSVNVWTSATLETTNGNVNINNVIIYW
jgi:hypothetical protein